LTSDGDGAANQANLNRAMKELTIAALLYRCGDRNGRAAAVLRQYARDLHGHFARYAAQTLASRGETRGP
jgi:predicted AAA+ superfamily ATPase